MIYCVQTPISALNGRLTLIKRGVPFLSIKKKKVVCYLCTAVHKHLFPNYLKYLTSYVLKVFFSPQRSGFSPPIYLFSEYFRIYLLPFSVPNLISREILQIVYSKFRSVHLILLNRKYITQIQRQYNTWQTPTLKT